MTRVNQILGDVYQISKEGGWGYDLVELKGELRTEAQRFAAATGKQCDIIDEKTIPDARVVVYPADDDTYSAHFPSHRSQATLT